MMYILISQVDVPGLSSASLLEVGPVSMSFELPKQTCTGLQIRFLRLSQTQTGLSQRWVRYVTHSDSYTIRIWPNQTERTGNKLLCASSSHKLFYFYFFWKVCNNYAYEQICSFASFIFFIYIYTESRDFWRYNNIVSCMTVKIVFLYLK